MVLMTAGGGTGEAVGAKNQRKIDILKRLPTWEGLVGPSGEKQTLISDIWQEDERLGQDPPPMRERQ